MRHIYTCAHITHTYTYMQTHMHTHRHAHMHNVSPENIHTAEPTTKACKVQSQSTSAPGHLTFSSSRFLTVHADKANCSSQRCPKVSNAQRGVPSKREGGGGLTSKTGRVACCIRVGALKFMASRCSHNTGANPKPCNSSVLQLHPGCLHATNTV